MTTAASAPRITRFLDLATVADVLAISIGKAYDLVRTGELVAIQLGGRRQWRVETVELEAFIARHYAQTRALLETRQSRTGTH